ncbi:MAG: hypothetical protein JNL32_02740, partial [Candidatus Kapabacteria bacterium]|nr:hypothetical protein [Candidatus Kapabacteria bacterium]
MKSILVMIVILVFHASASSVHAQWTTANGLSGGNIRSITSSGGMMYAAAYGGGVFMSSNAGSSWLKIQADSVLNMNVTAVKTFGVYLFAGTDFGAYRTSNQGAVWEKCNNGMGSPGINSFVVSGTLLYAVSNNGLFSSSDYGSSWNRLSGTFPAQDCKSLYVNGTTLYVGLYRQGMYKSVNGGSSWTAINSGLPPVAEQNPGTIIEDATGLYVSNYGAQGGIYKSSDAGSSWSYISTGLINSFVSSMYKNGAVFVVGTVDGIFRTTDNGVSFTAIATSPSTDEDIQCLYSDANGLYAGLQGSGVYRSSDNGVRWTSSNTGLSALTINNVELKNSQLYLSSIYGGHVYSSSDNGVSWQQAGTGLSQVRYGAVGASSNALLTGTYFSSGGLFYSSDNGFSWSPRSAQLLNSWIMSIKYSGSAWFAGTWGDGLYRSVDGGITWSKTDMGDAFLLNIGANANTVLAGTWGGKSIYRSGNGGVSWSVSNVGVGDGKSVQDFHYFGGSFYTAVFGMGILRSTDDGQSWVQTISGLSTSEVFSVTSSGKVLFAGTNGSGVCRSLDSGASWRVFTTNIHGLRINDMIAQNNTLIAATNGGAVFTHSVIQHEVGVLKQQAFCAGTVIKLPVNTWAQYSSGNVFRAELSDASGSFSSPVVIG